MAQYILSNILLLKDLYGYVLLLITNGINRTHSHVLSYQCRRVWPAEVCGQRTQVCTEFIGQHLSTWEERMSKSSLGQTTLAALAIAVMASFAPASRAQTLGIPEQFTA